MKPNPQIIKCHSWRVNILNPMIVTIFIILISACSQTLRFDQTCITCIKSQRLICKEGCPTTFLDSGKCLVTIVETGENIFMDPILKEEKIQPKEGIAVAIAQLNGKFYLTADNFRNLWILEPKPSNEAKFYSLKLPKDSIDKPVFDLFNNRLRLTANNYKQEHYILVDDSKWSLSMEAKAGE
jgi:hypothetical protein